MGGTLTTNAIKIDIDADGVDFGTNIINGINLNFNSNSVSGTGTYTGISSQGNSDNNELFTAGYFKATANNNGQAISLHTDGTVKMENIDLDNENSTKSLFLNSNNEVVYKSEESSSQCDVFYKEGFDVSGQIPAGWVQSPNSVYNQVGTQSCSNSTFDYKISRNDWVSSDNININNCDELIVSYRIREGEGGSTGLDGAGESRKW